MTNPIQWKTVNGNEITYSFAGGAEVKLTAMDNKPLTVAESIYLLEATKHNILTSMRD